MYTNFYRSRPHIYTVDVPNFIEEKQIQSFLLILSKEERRRLLRIKNKRTFYQSLIGKILIRYILIKKYNYSPNNINIKLSKYGKPYLDDTNNINFNIAHSHKLVAAIFDDSHTVGVDLEKKNSIDLNNIDGVFCDFERKVFEGKSVNERLDYFYDIWTLKESYLKNIGHGLSISLASFGFKKINSKYIIDNNYKDYYKFKIYDVDKNYVLTTCVNNKNCMSSEPIHIQFNNLIN
ncbi:4'-phosphopantetheinyl transferase family protein [Oceanobacillus kimchii]|uniref:4'-phosphopantetheinyl transferase family protein n=1 Tax=Oceanobacillus kimchii TaxID=746691 RepID=UPI003B019B82